MRQWTKIGGALLCAVLLSATAASAQGGRGAAPGGQGAGGGGRGRGAAAPAVIPVHPQDLAGYWILPPDGRDGRLVPQARLVPSVTAQARAAAVAQDKAAVRYCNPIGMPAAMGLGTPYNIRISPHLMVIMTEYSAAQNRLIYLNRKEHIPDDAYDRGVYGDSIAHWEGNTLVVDTTMFDHTKGIVSIPGGGFRTAQSKLVERFTLMKNGTVLQLVSTWTDPTMFAAPHTYEYRFNRMPRDYDGRLGSGCDPYDADRVALLSKMQ